MADVIVYDALVGQAIIAGLPETVQKVYVGKRSSHHAMSQEEISRLLVSYAERGKNVVRLKGGDPFLFGRGGEEIEELLAGGKAQKGDVIYFEPVSWEEEDADCHIGFFWGDNSNDNRFWHSASIP